MAKAIWREGFEFSSSEGHIWLTLPLYELSYATTETVKNDLLRLLKADQVFVYIITCRKAYRQKGKHRWYQRKAIYVKYHIIGHNIKRGESIKTLYDIIDNALPF